jgi:enoyl-CoA hydratase
VPGDELLAEAQKVADKLATGSQTATRLTKRALNLWMNQATPAFDASLAFEMLGFMGADAAEGVTALREKREPNFD